MCWTQPALAHDPPAIQPTRLDFDASSAPKKCRDDENFRKILWAWVPPEQLREDAERRLVVRIQSSSTGGKRADVSLINGEGVVVAERHTSYTAKMECHTVLWETARDAARVLGAFEPPLPKEPITCPTFPPCPECPLGTPSSTCPSLRPPKPTFTRESTPPRFFVGIGAFVGSGIFAKLNAGPQMLLGFVPSRDLPQLHLEFEGAWTSEMSESIRTQSIPLVGSVCWLRGVVRFCGGIATTFLSSNQLPNHELHLLGPKFRIGTELFSQGSFSIRADVFGRVAVVQQSIGIATTTLGNAVPFVAGVAVIAGRSFD